MKLQEFIEQVKKTEDYRIFSKECPGAYLCAGFFIIDYKEGHNEISIDFFNPNKKNIMSFKFQDKIVKVPLEAIKEDYTPEKIDEVTHLEVEQLKGILVDEMHNRSMTYEVQKLIVILQNIDGKLIWNVTALLSGLALLKSHVEDSSGTVIFMEKSSFFDFIKPVKLKEGQTLKEALEEIKEEKEKVDPEKAEGANEGFIG